jgi:F420-dependent oxidoreductase-like protein
VAWRNGDAIRLRIVLEPRRETRYDEIRALALAAEQAGFDGFFRSDHLLGVDPDDPAYRPTDCWATLAGLARDTKRLRLGSLVTAATFRAPGLVATTVSTVDDMSGGRVELGIGAAWYGREHTAFGLPFPPVGTRFDRLEEQLAIITGLWRAAAGQQPGFSFDGTHYRVEDNRTPPRPVQSPHPPIIIGGIGAKRTPAIAAQYADEFNGALGGDLRKQYAVFARACEAIGRDPDEPRLSAVLPVACGATHAEARRRGALFDVELLRAAAAIGSPEQITERILGLGEMGADTVYLHMFDVDALDHLALLGAEVLPHVAGALQQATAS